jgi:hypothetical protein
MDDPLFGISYDPQKVHFEEAPALISKVCPSLRGRKLWVYARSKAADTEYFIVSGYVKFRPDGPGPAGIEPDFGVAISLRGTSCTTDQAEYFLRGEINPARRATPIKVSEDILNAIVADALNRYSKAFGGKTNFLELLSGDHSREGLPPVLQRQLEQFEK